MTEPIHFSHDTFISPLTWRYGSAEMRHIWSETRKRQLMRQVWIALATAQQRAGLVTQEQVDDLIAHQDDIDIPRALEIEKETRHDVMAEIRAYAEQCPIGGGIIHWGATSADVNDNVYALRMKASAERLLDLLKQLLDAFADKIEETADWPVMAHTHIQPAEPTTLGYRLAVYTQDLLADFEDLSQITGTIRGKGFKGAVGTQAGYDEILAESDMSTAEMEAIAMQVLNLDAYRIATQTYSRRQDLRIMQTLSAIAASLHKFAFDFRILQSPPFGEWAEPFGKRQVGSSAMPFKRNPINMENICSLARYIGALPAVAWDNASQAILERSLDDSANRRLFIAEGFLATEEILRRAVRIVKDMRLNREIMRKNLETYGPFSATEKILMALVKKGVNRDDGHEWLRESSLAAWASIQQGLPNPLVERLIEHPQISQILTANEIQSQMAAESHVGTAEARALAMAQVARDAIA